METAKTEKKRKWVKLIVLLIIIALLSATVTELLFYYSKYIYKVKKVTVYNMSLTVGNTIGFNLDAQELNFGTLMAGGGSKREVFMIVDKPTKVIIFMEGELANWTSVSDNDFIFEGNKSIIFTAVVPENASLGTYKGKAILVLREP